METRYNLKSPGEPGCGGGRAGDPGLRARLLGRLVSAGPRGCSGLALYARPRPVRGCRPQSGRPLRIPRCAGAPPLLASSSRSLRSEAGDRRAKGQVRRRRRPVLLTIASFVSPPPLPTNFC